MALSDCPRSFRGEGWGVRQEEEAGPGCGFPGSSTWGRGLTLLCSLPLCLFVFLKSAVK